MGRSTYLLYDQRDRTFFYICAGDGQRYPFGLRVHTDNHEVTGTTTTGNERSFYYQLRYIFRKESF